MRGYHGHTVVVSEGFWWGRALRSAIIVQLTVVLTAADRESMMCVNAAWPVPTACAWKPVTRHHHHRAIGVPGLSVRVGRGSSGNVRYEIFYSDASRTGPFATVVRQSHSPSPSSLARVLVSHRRVSFPYPSPLKTNVSDNKNYAISH